MESMYSVDINVLFSDPFWIAVIEKRDKKNYSVCKVTFGPEPKDYEVYKYLQKNFYNLKFSPDIKSTETKDIIKNPKRVQRELKKQAKKNKEIGTKAQRALNLLHDENKLKRKTKSKEKREEEAKRKFELKQEKRKNKHKGR